MPTEVEVVCPDEAAAGSTISVATDYGSFDVVVPNGVEPGQPFTVMLPDAPTVDAPVELPADAEPLPVAAEHPDGYGGLGVVAEQLEEAHRVAAEFFNTDGTPLDMRDLKPGAAEVLAAALRGAGRAVIVGEGTYGKGATQALVYQRDGCALLFTAYTLHSGGAPLTRGVAPHVRWHFGRGDPERLGDAEIGRVLKAAEQHRVRALGE